MATAKTIALITIAAMSLGAAAAAPRPTEATTTWYSPAADCLSIEESFRQSAGPVVTPLAIPHTPDDFYEHAKTTFPGIVETPTGSPALRVFQDRTNNRRFWTFVSDPKACPALKRLFDELNVHTLDVEG